MNLLPKNLVAALLMPAFCLFLSAAKASTFKERKMALADQAINFWSPHYDESIGLVEIPSSIRSSAWLALCYLMKGTELERANDLLRAVMENQLHDGEQPGNFKRDHHDEGLTDQNVAAFAVPTLAYIFNHHYDDLQPDVQASLAECLAAAEECIINLEANHIPVWYENIYLSLIDAAVMLGNEEKALEWTGKYYDFIEQYGKNEYGSWNYDLVQLAALQNAFSHADDPVLKGKLGELLEYHWYVLAHQLHPATLMISPTASRAKGSRSGRKTVDSVATAHYLYFNEGQLSDFGKPRVELLLSDYQPPSEIAAIYREKQSAEVEWQARFGRVDAHVYQTPEYSLATQSGRRSSLGAMHKTKDQLSNSTQEVDIQLIADNPGPRKGIPFRTSGYAPREDDFNHHWITSVQKKNKAVVSFNHDPKGRRGFDPRHGRRGTEPAIFSEAPLGDFSEITSSGGMQINGVKWDGTPRALSTDDCLTYRLGDTYIGLRFLETDVIRIAGHDVVSESKPIHLRREQVRGDDVVHLTSYLAYDTEPMEFTEQDRRLGYVIEMAPASDYASLDAFSKHMAKISISQSLGPDAVHTVTVTSGNDVLSLREDLAKNIILSRKINGVEYNNGYLLASHFVSYPAAEGFSQRRAGKRGELPYPVPAPPPTENTYLSFAAEDFFLMEPMIRRADPEALSGYAIETIEQKRGEAARGIEIPYTDDWRVWLRVRWMDGSSDSCFFRFNYDNVGFPRTIVTAPEHGRYHWIMVPDIYSLHRGIHTLRIEGRETVSAIDMVLVTNDPLFHPENDSPPAKSAATSAE